MLVSGKIIGTIFTFVVPSIYVVLARTKTAKPLKPT
jgi:hypothetical protein